MSHVYFGTFVAQIIRNFILTEGRIELCCITFLLWEYCNKRFKLSAVYVFGCKPIVFHIQETFICLNDLNMNTNFNATSSLIRPLLALVQGEISSSLSLFLWYPFFRQFQILSDILVIWFYHQYLAVMQETGTWKVIVNHGVVQV